MSSAPLHHLPADVLARLGLILLRRHRTTADLRLPDQVAAFVRHNVLAGRHPGPLTGALFVDRHLRPLGYSLPYLGYLSDADVEPGKLLVPGLIASAAALLLFQQRPTGDLEADPYDIAAGESIRDAGELVKLRLLDHLLIGPNGGWTSLREARILILHDLADEVTLPYLANGSPQIDRRRRVKPKYVNPADPRQTWSGRGRKARWLREALDAGARLEDFLVDDGED